jgi:ribosome maturation protein SDO1
MRIRVIMPAKEGKRLKDKVVALVDTVEDEYWGDEWELVRHLGVAPMFVRY